MSGVYLVTGKRSYRGHEPGSQFEVTLPANAEVRAIQRGAIALVRRYTPALPDEHIFPSGWLAAHTTNDSRR